MNGQTRLYTPELLAAAVRLADYPLATVFPMVAETRSPTCGSTLRIGIDCDGNGRIAALGVRAQACAVGQAAAATFVEHAAGRTRQEIIEAADELRRWLADPAIVVPAWPGIGLLEPARAYPARHGAILLAWDAAVQALSNPAKGG